MNFGLFKGQNIDRFKIVIVAVAVIVLISALSINAYASYVMTSNHVAGSPKTQVSLTLTSNSSVPTVGDTLMLTVHVSDNSAGDAIVLVNNGASVGSPVSTDSIGNAVFYVVVSASYDFVASGTHN